MMAEEQFIDDTALEQEVVDDVEENLEEQENETSQKDQQINELMDRLKRNMAEFDNFRKRTEKEKASMYDMGAKDALEKILPVIDNFERALNAIPEEEKSDGFVKGVDMIYKQMVTVLNELGVNAIEAVGNEFNPNLHNAVNHEEDDNYGSNVVAEEYQKGYMYKDSVLRYSMVKVVN